jgi:hypothetical protein
LLEHSSTITYQREQYLICLKNDQSKLSSKSHEAYSTMDSIGHSASSASSSSSDDGDELISLRTVEKSRSFTNQQQATKSKRQNRWEPTNQLARPLDTKVATKSSDNAAVTMDDLTKCEQTSDEVQQSTSKTESFSVMQNENESAIFTVVEGERHDRLYESVDLNEDTLLTAISNNECQTVVINEKSTQQFDVLSSALLTSTLNIEPLSVAIENETVEFIENVAENHEDECANDCDELQQAVIGTEVYQEHTTDSKKPERCIDTTEQSIRSESTVEHVMITPEDMQLSHSTTLDGEVHHVQLEHSLSAFEQVQTSPIVHAKDETSIAAGDLKVEDNAVSISNELSSVIDETSEQSMSVSNESTQANVVWNESIEQTFNTAVVTEMSLPSIETLPASMLIDCNHSVEEKPSIADDCKQETQLSQQIERCQSAALQDEKSNIIVTIDANEFLTTIADQLSPLNKEREELFPSIISNSYCSNETNLSKHIVFSTSIPSDDAVKALTIDGDQPMKINAILIESRLDQENQPLTTFHQLSTSISEHAVCPVTYKLESNETALPLKKQSTSIINVHDQKINQPVRQAKHLARTNNELEQFATSTTKQAYSTVVKKNSTKFTGANSTITPCRRISDENTHILSTHDVNVRQSLNVLVEQPVDMVKYMATPVVSSSAIKTSSTRNKRSRRTSTKNRQIANSIVLPSLPAAAASASSLSSSSSSNILEHDKDEKLESSCPRLPSVSQTTTMEHHLTSPAMITESISK